MRSILFGILIVSGSIFLNCKNRVVETNSTTSKDSMTIRSKNQMDSLKMKKLKDSVKASMPKDSLRINKEVK